MTRLRLLWVGSGPSAAWQTRAKALLDRQAAAEQASSNIVYVMPSDQPPADLLISITPGIRRLVDATQHAK